MCLAMVCLLSGAINESQAALSVLAASISACMIGAGVVKIQVWPITLSQCRGLVERFLRVVTLIV